MIRPSVQLLRGLAVVVLLILWAVLAHDGTAGIGNLNLTTALGIAPIVAAAGLMLWRSRHPLLTATGVVGLLGSLFWLWPTLRHNNPLLFFIQHVGSNLALGTLFGRSLIGQGEALITQLARAVHHGEISARKTVYTRRATLAWTLFFLINASLSALLYLLAPLEIWSVFANLLSMPLLVAMFVAEHFWRVQALPPEERPTIAQVIRAYRMHSRTDHPPGTPS